jgi:hypothetical protein
MNLPARRVKTRKDKVQHNEEKTNYLAEKAETPITNVVNNNVIN